MLVEPGDVVRVIDLEGSQVADLVVFAPDRSELFSQGLTRMNNGTARVRRGDSLYSNRNTVMATVLEDDVGGVHDILYPPCNRYLYETFYGVDPRDGCRETLASALATYGIWHSQITDSLNIFMNAGVDSERRMFIGAPTSRPGDAIALRFEVSCIVGVASCADDVSACNGGLCTAIGVELNTRG